MIGRHIDPKSVPALSLYVFPYEQKKFMPLNLKFMFIHIFKFKKKKPLRTRENTSGLKIKDLDAEVIQKVN
jgi:hypothetical protein